METERERLLAAFVVTLIPCAARTVIILGLVGRFVGLHAALTLYALDLILLAQLIPLESLSTVQMMVFALVTMIYIPCAATIAALIKEFGWKKASAITLVDVTAALLLGGVTSKILQAFLG